MGMSTSEMEVEEGIGGTEEVNWRRNEAIREDGYRRGEAFEIVICQQTSLGCARRRNNSGCR
jgi:hypothetical protein